MFAIFFNLTMLWGYLFSFYETCQSNSWMIADEKVCWENKSFDSVTCGFLLPGTTYNFIRKYRCCEIVMLWFLLVVALAP
uniref:Ion transport domain-containing protein n=1 Tax=Setaria viridis TaxID=4556 RepID=A0A4U6SR67_SETVI|nr:hypothetical protein SEVIR_9G081850v2 [Setaria viridis]